MDEAARLIARAERIAKSGERMSAAFAAELAGIWKAVERALSVLVLTVKPQGAPESSVRLFQLRERVRAVLQTAGYDSLIVAATDTGIRAIASAAGALATSSTPLQVLRNLAVLDLRAQGDDAATAIWRAINQYALTDTPVDEIIDALGETLDSTASEVQRLYDTQVSIFGRQVEAEQTEELGDQQPYLYVGPIDSKTRDWCLERVGRVFTRAEIDDMDNGQIANTFLSGGGFNCRHSFIAVESQALRGMVGTRERVDQIGSDVQRVRALKEAKRAAKRKAA